MNQEDKGSVASKKSVGEEDKDDSVNAGTKHHGVPRTESKATSELSAAPERKEAALTFDMASGLRQLTEQEEADTDN